jgi:hypothetical protein
VIAAASVLWNAFPAFPLLLLWKKGLDALLRKFYILAFTIGN